MEYPNATSYLERNRRPLSAQQYRNRMLPLASEVDARCVISEHSVEHKGFDYQLREYRGEGWFVLATDPEDRMCWLGFER
jgi:hypothetical protein